MSKQANKTRPAATTTKEKPAAGWTCPDCGLINDFCFGECSCGTTYDDPVVEEELIVGEVLPPETTTLAVVPALAPDVAVRVEAINALHDEIEEHLAAFAERVVRCGLELLELKKQVGHGKWEKFFEQNISRQRFQLRNAQKYMEVAKAVKAKIAGKEGGMEMLLSGEESGDDGADQFDVIRDTLADMTDARSWQQLWMDFGLLRPKMQRGGNHGGGAARAALAQFKPSPMELEAMVSQEQWKTIVMQLREFAQNHRHVHIDEPTLTTGIASIKDCLKMIMG